MALSVDCIVIEFCLYIYKPCGCLKKLSVYAKLVYLNVFIEIDFLADQQDDVFFERETPLNIRIFLTELENVNRRRR